MKSPKAHSHAQSEPSPAASSVKRARTRAISVVVAVCGLLLLLGIFLLRSRSSEALKPAGEVPVVTEAPATPAAVSPSASPARPQWQKLVGKWLRPDGGYVLEIRSVAAGGNVQAAYFNPRPITVFRAQAAFENAITHLAVELRDVGYPGCVYTLTYDPSKDQLIGNYYQAAIQQNFAVVFERIP